MKNNHKQMKKKIPKSPSVMESMMAHEYKESELFSISRWDAIWIIRPRNLVHMKKDRDTASST